MFYKGSEFRTKGCLIYLADRINIFLYFVIQILLSINPWLLKLTQVINVRPNHLPIHSFAGKGILICYLTLNRFILSQQRGKDNVSSFYNTMVDNFTTLNRSLVVTYSDWLTAKDGFLANCQALSISLFLSLNLSLLFISER